MADPIRVKFPEGTRQRIADARRALSDVVDILRRAEDSGMDVSTFNEVRGEIDKRLASVEENFRHELDEAG